MSVFRTIDLPPERRAASWTAFYSSRFAPVEFKPLDDEDFNAELTVAAIPPLEVAEMRSGGYCAERTQAHVAATPDRKFGFIMLIEGNGVARHCGRETELSPGDVLVNDNTSAMSCRFRGPFHAITVRAPEDVVRSRMPRVEELCGLRLPAAAGFTRAVSTMARCLLDQAVSGIPADCGATMGGQLLDVLATCYFVADRRPASEQSAMKIRHAMARQFIERNLPAPDLSAEHVAAALCISPRYLRVLMAEAGETVSTLILRRRLEEAAKQLASPLCRDRKISDIAASWGFKSSAHFAHAFKAHYGVTPREHRLSDRGIAIPARAQPCADAGPSAVAVPDLHAAAASAAAALESTAMLAEAQAE